MPHAYTTLHATRLREVQIPVGRALMRAYLHVPPQTVGTIVMAHGSDVPLCVDHNRLLCEIFGRASLATLCLAAGAAGRGTAGAVPVPGPRDLTMLAADLGLAASWLDRVEVVRTRPLGLLVSGVFAPAAITAIDALRGRVGALVVCDGEHDLDLLARTHDTVPTMLITAGLHDRLVDASCGAYITLWGPRRLEFIAGARHVFEQPSTLTLAADLAAGWFRRYVRPPARRVSQVSGNHSLAR